ncbi:MAG: phytoene/squalene synthase family protein [Calditrichia bacterium]
MEYITNHNRAQFRYARSMTAYYSKSFYLSTCLLPRHKRWATFALYAFCRHIDNLTDIPRGRSEQEILRELKYLEGELKTAYRTGESEHPIVGPFISVANEYDISQKYPLELIKGVQMDTKINRYKTFDDLYLFAYRVAGVVGLMMTPLLGYKNPDAMIYAEKLGVAMQLTNILRDIREDKEMDRIYIPLEEIRIFGLKENHFFEEKISENFKNLMKFQVDRTHHFYDEADKGIKMLDRNAQFAIYSASKIYRGILRKIELQNYNPFQGRVYVPQSKKAQIVISEAVRTKLFLLPTPAGE